MSSARNAAKQLYHSLVATGHKCRLGEGSKCVTIDPGEGELGSNGLVIKADCFGVLTGELYADRIMEVPDERREAVVEVCKLANDMLHNTRFFIGYKSQLCCSAVMLYASRPVEMAYQDSLTRIGLALFIFSERFARAVGLREPSELEADGSIILQIADGMLPLIGDDEEGNRIRCHVLLLLEHEGRNIIVFEDDDRDKEGNANAYASLCNPEDLAGLANRDPCTLSMKPITHEGDWKAIETALSELQTDGTRSLRLTEWLPPNGLQTTRSCFTP